MVVTSDRARQRIENIQLLRGLSVILVIVFHLSVMDRLYGGSRLFGQYFNFGSVGVDIFFVISGFVMTYISLRRFDETGFVKIFLLHRLARILPLYWLLTSLVFCFSLIYPNMINNSSGNRIDVLASFLFLPSDVLPLVPVGWSLNYEMYFYLVFAVFIGTVPRRLLSSAILVWALLASVLSLAPYLFPQFVFPPAWSVYFSPFVLEFAAGCAVGLISHQKRFLNGTLAWSVSFVFFLVGVGCLEYLNPGKEYHPWARVLAFTLPSALLVYGAVLLDRVKGGWLSRSLALFGDASYSLYLTHLLAMHFVGKFIWVHFGQQFISENVAVNIAFAGLNTLAAIVVGLATYYLLEKPCIRFARQHLDDLNLANWQFLRWSWTRKRISD